MRKRRKKRIWATYKGTISRKKVRYKGSHRPSFYKKINGVWYVYYRTKSIEGKKHYNKFRITGGTPIRKKRRF